MAHYEHLPIYRAAFDLAVHLENLVRHFDRYHKYGLGAELRARSRRVLAHIIAANNRAERTPCLEALREEIEQLKVSARLCHESGGFRNTRAYLHLSEQLVGIARQNEGWLRHARGRAAERGLVAACARCDRDPAPADREYGTWPAPRGILISAGCARCIMVRPSRLRR